MFQLIDYIKSKERVYAVIQKFSNFFASLYFRIYSSSPLWLQKVFSSIHIYLVRIKMWLLVPIPRWRTMVTTAVFIAIMEVVFLYGGASTYAATFTFNQTDWSSGISVNTIVHPTNTSGWAKYSAQTNADVTSTPGVVKIDGSTGTYDEGFTATTYKDAGATTATWDTSAHTLSHPVTISGTLYGTDESTVISTTPTVKMKIGGVTSTMSTTAAANGTFSFAIAAANTPADSTIITIWISGATEKGSLVFRYGSSCTGYTDCTGLAVYRNEVIFSSYDGSALTHTDISACDNDSGTNCSTTDIGFTSNSGTLTLTSGLTFRLKDSSASFTQGGTISTPNFKQSAGTFTGATQSISVTTLFTQSGGAFTSTSGTLNIFTGTLSGNSTVVSISGGTFTHASGTVNFGGTLNAGCSSYLETIDLNTSLSLYNVTFNGTDGGCNGSVIFYGLGSGDTLTMNGNLTLTSGAIYSTGTFNLEGNITIASGADNTAWFNTTGIINMTGTGSKTYTYTSGGFAPRLYINSSSLAVTPNAGTSNLKVAGLQVLAGAFTAPTGTLTLDQQDTTASYTLLNVSSGATFTHNSGTVSFNGAATACTALTYTIDVPTTLTLNNVAFAPATEGACNGAKVTFATGSGDTVIAAGTMTITNGKINGTWEAQGNLNIASGSDGGTASISMTGNLGQTVTYTAGSFPTGTFTINKTNNSDQVTLASNLTLGGALTVTKGIFDQGASYNLTTGGAVSVGANGTWSNTGTGDITLAGNVTNSGTVTLNGNAASCGEADDITITTSSVPTTRSWAGSGTYSLWDLNVLYQTGSRTAYSSTQGTGATWTFPGSGCTTGMIEGPYFGKGPSLLDNIIQYVSLSRDFILSTADSYFEQTKVFAYKMQNIFARNIDTYSQFANNVSDTLIAQIPVYYDVVSNNLNKLQLAAVELFKVEEVYAAATGVGQSIKVNAGSENVGPTTLTSTTTLNGGTVTYYLSNDGGVNFFAVTPSTPYTFASAGNDLRWQVVITGGAVVTNIHITYQYYTSASLTSSAYDTADATNLVTKVAWVASSETATETVKIQVRTSPDGATWSEWCGYEDCTGTSYFDVVGENNVALTSNHTLRSGGNDRWFQYKVTFASSGLATPSFDDISVTYVVNAPPEFNPTNGVVASQISDSGDSNWGKVQIVYSVRDADTATGTTDPGYVTPSFEYNIGGGWVAISSGNLTANSTDHKSVGAVSYSDYTTYWDAKTVINANYSASAQIRVTVNDQEPANNTASGTSSSFTLDTTNPTVSAFTVNSATDVLTISGTDNVNLQYRLSNNADFSSDGVNGTSGEWQTVGASSLSVTPSWVFAGAPSAETVYLAVRDIYGNITSTSAVAPATVGGMYLQDTSNLTATTYKEFISWSSYTSVAGSTFTNYKVYSSTDGSSYNLVATITDINTNYYVDNGLTADQTYYYRVNVTDSDGDMGNYSEVANDIADGQGGTDVTAPDISAVTVAESQATYAKITWTTDELATSEVDYSVSPSTAFTTHATSGSYVTSHSVTITDLTPDTIYLFRVKSEDVNGNVATNDNTGAGFTINTSTGVLISNVTETEVNEHSATVVWNTTGDADSYVSYSTSSDLSSPTRVGSNDLVGGPPYQHKVSLSGLATATHYYYFVESTDGSANYVKDTNGNNYYTFVTTSDTKPPVISNVTAPITGLTSAVITWNTDEIATGIVDYGISTGTYTTSTTLDTVLSTSHVGSITGLTQNKKYYYRVRSSDDANNESTSEEYDFTTDDTHNVVIGYANTATGNTTADTTKPVVDNIKVKDIKSFSATVSFNTNENALGFVDYGTDANDLGFTSGSSSFAQSFEVKLTGLQMGKKYTYVVKAVDKAGNTTIADAQTFTTSFFTESTIQLKDAEAFQKELQDAIESALPSLVPPFIEKPTILNITDNSAQVVWKTNIKSYGSVSYAEEDNYDEKSETPYEAEAANTSDKVIDHQIDLINLKANTRYHIMVRAYSLAEVAGKTADITFVTEAPKIQANIGSVTNDSFRATWVTSEPTTSVVEYKNIKTGEFGQRSSDTKITSHDVVIDGLIPGSTYSVNVYGVNSKGNKVSITSAVRITTSIDTAAPVITGLTIDSALIPGRSDRTQTIISWKTNEPSTSTVFFKEGSVSPDEKLANKVEQNTNFVLDHAVVVSSLKPGGLYSIQVSSTDSAGNTTLFPVRTAVVPQQGQSVIEIIFKNFEDTFKFLK